MSRARALVVDDEEMIRRCVRRVLRDVADVDECASGEEALARLERGAAFDVVLLDLHLGMMNGAVVYERLRTARPALGQRVVILSGGSLSAEDTAFLASVDGPVLSKPFAPSELRAAVEACCARGTPT